MRPPAIALPRRAVARRLLALLGAAGVGGVLQYPSAAAKGEPVLAGRGNDSGNAGTSLRAHPENGAVLTLAVDGEGDGAALRLEGDLAVAGGSGITIQDGGLRVETHESAIWAYTGAGGSSKAPTIYTYSAGGYSALTAMNVAGKEMGIAVEALGRLVFSPAAGSVRVPSGADSAEVSFPRRFLSSASLVLATAQTDTEVYVKSARVISARAIRISLSSQAVTPTTVAYLVLN